MRGSKITENDKTKFYKLFSWPNATMTLVIANTNLKKLFKNIKTKPSTLSVLKRNKPTKLSIQLAPNSYADKPSK